MLSRLLTRKEQLVLTGFALAIVTGASVLCLYEGGATSPESSETPTTSKRADAAAEPGAGELLPPSATLESTTSPDVDSSAPPTSRDVPRVAEPLETPPIPGPVVVSVAGAVFRPGVYELEEGDRVQDLIEEAGGARESADLSDVNLAAPLVDGTTLTIPESPPSRSGKGPLVIGRPPSPTALNPPFYTISGWRPAAAESPQPVPHGQASLRAGTDPSGLIDLNHATSEQLESLPGIGPKLAAEIIQYRAHSPLHRVDDALNVSGIGTKRLEAIRPFVCVSAKR